jgi:predicted TIM-barrel fold metal-dependent hydrolase
MRGLDIHDELDHPVIDADGHLLEFMPASLPYLREALTGPQFDAFVKRSSTLTAQMTGESLAERRASRLPRGGWWASPVRNAKDLATSMSPRLMHERLPELGFDYSILYPTHALGGAGILDPDLRIAMCRGMNEYLAGVYGPYADRYTVAAAIPMHTPEEAIAELEHCKGLGLKVVAIPPGVLRPIARPSKSAWLAPDQTHWWDHFGLDSEYDYDPVWRRFAELGFAVTVHWGVGGPLGANYPFVTSWMANHIGSFAAATAPMVKAVYLGGVTHRVPEVVFAFQECGVGFATSMLCDTIEHWEKRNVENLHEFYDPKVLDLDALESLMREHSPEFVGDQSAEEFRAALVATIMTGEAPEQLDEWIEMGIGEKRDLVDLFTSNFYFGCEADDRGIANAYASTNPMGAELKAILGSDISHFDVPDFEQVLVDAHSLVSKNVITEDQFKKFTFENVAELLMRADHTFFQGTAVENEVKGVRGTSTQ